jgi:hypothetical protein
VAYSSRKCFARINCCRNESRIDWVSLYFAMLFGSDSRIPPSIVHWFVTGIPSLCVSLRDKSVLIVDMHSLFEKKYKNLRLYILCVKRLININVV